MTRKNFNLTAVKPYNGVNLNIFTTDGDENFYIARKQVGDALGYSHGSEAVSQLHRDHAELLDFRNLSSEPQAPSAEIRKFC